MYLVCKKHFRADQVGLRCLLRRARFEAPAREHPLRIIEVVLPGITAAQSLIRAEFLRLHAVDSCTSYFLPVGSVVLLVIGGDHGAGIYCQIASPSRLVQKPPVPRRTPFREWRHVPVDGL